MRQPDLLKSLSKSFIVLEFLAESGKSLTFNELQKALKMPNASLYRILQTFVHHRILKFDSHTKTYSLGPYLIFLGNMAQKNMNLPVLALPVMERLRNHTNETITLFARVEYRKMCIQKVESDHTVRYTAELGKALHMHAGASGKVLLAGMSREEVEEMVRCEGLPKLSANTMTGLEEIWEESRKVLKRGYAVSISERHRDAAGVGVPVFDSRGCIVASLNISCPADRFPTGDPEKLEAWVQLLKEASEEISGSTGHAFTKAKWPVQTNH